jgi:micrococcal nuclease
VTETELLPLIGLTHVYPGDAAVEVWHVHDGDTFSADVPGWPDVIGRHILVRLHGVDAPELHDARPDVRALAQKARDRLVQLLAAGGVVLTSLRRDKYFRLLCSVGATAVADVGTDLIRDGLARPYTGHGPKPW